MAPPATSEYEAEPVAKSAPQKGANPAPAAKAAPAARPEATTPAASLASPDTTAPASKSEESRKADLIAELEKRKARAAKWGMPTGEAEAKLERAVKFGLDASKDNTLSALDGGLKGSNKREARAEAKAANGEEKAQAPAKPVETEEEKAARIARQEADEAAKKRRAERFGTQSTPAAAPAPTSDPAEEERKRKRMEKFGADVSNGFEEARRDPACSWPSLSLCSRPTKSSRRDVRSSTMLGNVFVSPTRPQWDRRSWNTNAREKRISDSTQDARCTCLLFEHAPASIMRLLLSMVKEPLMVDVLSRRRTAVQSMLNESPAPPCISTEGRRLRD